MKKSILVFAAILLLVGQSLFGQLQHRVERGDTLFSLSRRFGVPVDELKRVNNIASAESLRVGALLTIPQATSSGPTTQPQATLPATLLVNRGDTYFSIARRFNVSVDYLLARLERTRYTPLRAGEVLVFNQPRTVAVQPSPTLPVTPTAPTQPPITTPRQPEPNTRLLPPNTNLPIIDGLTWPARGAISPNNNIQGGVRITVTGEAAIHSVVRGKVTYIGLYRDLGHVVIVKHDSGYAFVYSGFSNIFVRVNQVVESGAILGNLTRSGDVVFSVFRDGHFHDPHRAPRI